MLHVATSNDEKFREIQNYIPEAEQLDIDTNEIQDTDHDAVVRDKARQAAEHETQVMVEDTALHLSCLNGLPGPFIKWFLKRLGTEGIYRLCQDASEYEARAVTKIAYHDGTDVKIFTGERKGRIVEPRGDGFGWDPLFEPDGYDATYAEMGEEKHETSHRTRALRAFTDWYETRH